jgi:hypothetical protein
MHVCSESRAIATKIYTLAFGSTSEPCTWFDFENDTLYLDWRIDDRNASEYIGLLPYLMNHLGEDSRKVLNLAVWDFSPPPNDDISPWEQVATHFIEWVIGIFGWFHALENFTVVNRAHWVQDDLVAIDGFESVDVELYFLEEMKEYTIELERSMEQSSNMWTGPPKKMAEAYAQVVQRLKDGYPTFDKKIKIPAISHKTFTTMKIRDAYIQAKTLYDIEKELHSTVVTFQCTERGPVQLAVQRTWTLNEVIERYRKAVKISPKWKYEKTTFDHGGVLSPESTVDDLDLTSASVLDIKFALRRSQRISCT